MCCNCILLIKNEIRENKSSELATLSWSFEESHRNRKNCLLIFFILHNTNCMAQYCTTNVVFVLIIVRKQEHSKVIEFLIKLSAPLNDRIPVFIFFFTYSVMICYPSLLQRRINTSRSCLMTFILPKKKTCID